MPCGCWLVWHRVIVGGPLAERRTAGRRCLDTPPARPVVAGRAGQEDSEKSALKNRRPRLARTCPCHRANLDTAPGHRSGAYLARYDDLFNGKDEKLDVSKVDVSMNGIELQDREFFAAVRERREPNSSVAKVLPCYRTLHQLEQQLKAG